MNTITDKIKHLALLLLFTCCFMPLIGQEVRIKAALERDTIWLGDQIKLLLVAEQPASAKIAFPHLPDSLQKIEVLQRSKIDTSKIEGGKLQLKQTFTITCFDSGVHPIPPLYFKLISAGRDSFATNGLRLNVRHPKVDLKKGPADIKKPFGAPITFKEIAPWLLGIILIGAIVFLVIYALSRWKKNRSLFERAPKPKLPPHVIALSELNQLKEEQLWQQGKVKDYYTRLTDILRNYLEERYSISAMEQTTIEILGAMKGLDENVGDKSVEKLRQLLELADLVKFAKFIPSEDENQKALNDGYLFVEETKIEEAIQPTEETTETITPEVKQEVTKEEKPEEDPHQAYFPKPQPPKTDSKANSEDHPQ